MGECWEEERRAKIIATSTVMIVGMFAMRSDGGYDPIWCLRGVSDCDVPGSVGVGGVVSSWDTH